MKWSVPAKTFLVGEYVALTAGPALLLTTTPCFELSLTTEHQLLDIAAGSPAGRWWLRHQFSSGLRWYDPYQGCGGMGASSAQFIATYLACCSFQSQKPSLDTMLEAYYQCAWDGKGLKPSGYDVIAQTYYGCVYINQKQKCTHPYSWVFEELALTLVHTGIKLATHHHLALATLPSETALKSLSETVELAKKAFEEQESDWLIQAVNQYHNQLINLDLVAPHTIELIVNYRRYPEVLAIKGCGALGSDVLLILSTKEQAPRLRQKLLQTHHHQLLATETNLHPQGYLMNN